VDNHQQRRGAATVDRGRVEWEVGPTSPVRGDAAMPDRGYVRDVPILMARGVAVTTEELAAAMGTRTALSGRSSWWAA